MNMFRTGYTSVYKYFAQLTFEKVIVCIQYVIKKSLRILFSDQEKNRETGRSKTLPFML